MGRPPYNGGLPDVVYVVKQAGTNDELRYSLRSLANLPHGRVWLVGHKPKWATGVEHLPTRNSRPTKYQNSTANLLTACTHDSVSDPFVYMNDDFFILQPIEAVPVLNRGPVAEVLAALERRIQNRSASRYRDGLVETRDLLDGWGYPNALSYELHVPMTIGKKAMVDVVRRASNEVPIVALHKRTLYGNVAEVGGSQIDDVKIANNNGIWERGQLFVSTNNKSFRSGRVGRRLRKVFAASSEYEA